LPVHRDAPFVGAPQNGLGIASMSLRV
jgi:hypothetical protein